MYDNEKQNGFPTGETSNNASQNQSEWNNQKQSAASSAQNTDRLNYESPRSSNQSAQNQTGQQNQTAQSQTTAGTNNTQYSGSYHYNQQQYRQQFGTSGTAQTAQTNWNYASQNSGYNQAYGQQQGTQGNPAGNYQPWGAVPPTKPPKQKKQKKQKTPKENSARKRLVLKIVAGLAACVVISAGSIGTFVALVNSGAITLTATSQQTSSNDNSSQSDSSSGTGVTQVSKEDSDALTLQEVAAKVTPSVVCIQNYQANGFTGEQEEAGEGSGIIMDEDGYIITNEHVVADATSLKVVLYDGRTVDATLVGSDTATDLALIKIEADGLTPATFGDADELSVGDQVVAIGNPGGLVLSSSVTFGYVSALNRSIETNNGYTVNCIQTDAAINPGNSGGALVNIYGQVVGINSSKIAATGYEGLGFAISINEALPVIESIKEYGYVKDRPVIGISYQFLDEQTAAYNRLPAGLYIVQVNSENAQKAGLMRGDVITKIEGKEVDSSSVIAESLQDKKPGDTLTMEVWRGQTGTTETITVTLSEYSAN